MRLGRRPLSRV